MERSEQQLRPRVGEWYLDLATEEEFRVIAVDDDERSVEVQYLDGDLTALDFDDWKGRDLEHTEEPEDWTGALEPIEDGDAGYDPESFKSVSGEEPPPGLRQDEVAVSEQPEAEDDAEAE